MERTARGEENLSQVELLEIQHGPPPPPRKCPRCDSLNTKFCYYNNYSHAQPRYLCKGCRRYWTHGGSLRNVPIGGGCRRNKRSKNVIPEVISPSSSIISTILPESQNYQGADVATVDQSFIGPMMMMMPSWTPPESSSGSMSFINVTPNTSSTQSSFYSFWNIGNNAAQLDSSFNPNTWFSHNNNDPFNH